MFYTYKEITITGLAHLIIWWIWGFISLIILIPITDAHLFQFFIRISAVYYLIPLYWSLCGLLIWLISIGYFKSFWRQFADLQAYTFTLVTMNVCSIIAGSLLAIFIYSGIQFDKLYINSNFAKVIICMILAINASVMNFKIYKRVGLHICKKCNGKGYLDMGIKVRCYNCNGRGIKS